MEDVVGVALVKEACPLCAKVEDGPILINQRLTKSEANKVKKMHGKTIGHMEQPCGQCQAYMEQGVLLIGVIERLTTDQQDPYRSGNHWVVTEDFVTRCFGNMAESIIKKRSAFFSLDAAREMGFPETDEDPRIPPK